MSDRELILNCENAALVEHRAFGFVLHDDQAVLGHERSELQQYVAHGGVFVIVEFILAALSHRANLCGDLGDRRGDLAHHLFFLGARATRARLALGGGLAWQDLAIGLALGWQAGGRCLDHDLVFHLGVHLPPFRIRFLGCSDLTCYSFGFSCFVWFVRIRISQPDCRALLCDCRASLALSSDPVGYAVAVGHASSRSESLPARSRLIRQPQPNAILASLGTSALRIFSAFFADSAAGQHCIQTWAWVRHSTWLDISYTFLTKPGFGTAGMSTGKVRLRTCCMNNVARGSRCCSIYAMSRGMNSTMGSLAPAMTLNATSR